MKYFLDTEFIEGFKQSYWKLPLTYKQRHFIDLISIGIVAEDGRKYYAVSNEFVGDDADEWVRENVIYPIIRENGYSKSLSNLHGVLSYSSSALKRVQKSIGKSNKQIAEEIKHFCDPKLFLHNTDEPDLQFYGYYADYDWVLFCSLFGRMIDLPKGFPMYLIDLKQMLDDKIQNNYLDFYDSKFDREHSFDEKLKFVKSLINYPKQKDEHNALADAIWNKELYDFLNKP